MKEERDVIGLTLTLSTNHDPATQIHLQIKYIKQFLHIKLDCCCRVIGRDLALSHLDIFLYKNAKIITKICINYANDNRILIFKSTYIFTLG